MRPGLFRKKPLLLMAGLCLAVTPAALAQQQYQQQNPQRQYQQYDESQYSDEYVTNSEQATKFFNSGEVSKAIELFQKALPQAPENSLPVVYNNLAASFIKRGNYYLQNKQYDQALSDFRMADYYIDYAWPEGVDRKPVHEQNRTVAKDDLGIAYRALRINPGDKAVHLEMGKQLRLELV